MKCKQQHGSVATADHFCSARYEMIFPSFALAEKGCSLLPSGLCFKGWIVHLHTDTHCPRRDLTLEAAVSLLGHSSVHRTLPVRDQGMNSSWSGENPEGPGPVLCHKAVTSLSPPKWFGSLKDQLLYLLFFPINMFFPGLMLPGHQYLLSGWDLLHQDDNYLASFWATWDPL